MDKINNKLKYNESLKVLAILFFCLILEKINIFILIVFLCLVFLIILFNIFDVT